MKHTSPNEISFQGKLISISSTPKSNVNGTMFRNASIEFVNKHGELVKRRAIVYEKNFSYGMEVGENYLAVARTTENGIILQMSHLSSAASATEDDFDF